MYAIIETGGKQLKVEEGQSYFIEKLAVEAGDEVVFDKVVALNTKELTLGTPYVDGASVKATVEKNGKGKKIVIYKYRPRSGSSHRKAGHRQPYTKVTINSINL